MPDEDIEIKSSVTVEDGSLHQTVGQQNGFEIKSDGDGRSFIKGYIATKDSYRIKGERFQEEAMTEEALRSIASQINNANRELKTADVVFPDPNVMEKTTGNIEHQNSQLMENRLPNLADTRAVPAIELASAEYDGYGVEVKAPIREDALPEDTVEAVKENIQDGVLSAFSIEFRNARDKLKNVGGKIKRMIKDVDVAGAGLTAQPKNPTATLTGAEIRSVINETRADRPEKQPAMIPMVEDVQLLYPSEGQAEAAAQNLGMDESAHSHMLDGEEWFMPGEDHPTFVERMLDMKEQMRLNAQHKDEMKAEFTYEVGDWVSRDWQGSNVFGKIRDRTMDQFTVDGNTITGDEGEPVYKMEEYDEEAEEFTGQMIAVPQSGVERWNSAPENKAVSDVDLSPPEKVVNAAQAALDAKEEYSDSVGDCGTGVGESRAERIVNDNLRPEDFLGGENTAIPDYLDSHEEDLSTTKPPTDWGEEEWTDGCGNLQYALWGYYNEWAQETERQLQDAKETEEMKAEVAGVEFDDTMEGELDESEIPNDDYEQHYLFPADTKSESSYPVVDADGNLRRGNVDAAHQLGARGGVDASELDRKLKMLNKEFDNPPISFKDGENKSLNDNMPEDDGTEGDGQENQPDEEDGQEQENKSELQETVETLKETVEEVKSQNEELQEENEELKSQLEDESELEELKSDLGTMAEELKSIRSEDQPVSDPDEQKHETEEDQTPQELKAAGSEFIQKNKSVLAQEYSMTEEEVLEHA